MPHPYRQALPGEYNRSLGGERLAVKGHSRWAEEPLHLQVWTVGRTGGCERVGQQLVVFGVAVELR